MKPFTLAEAVSAVGGQYFGSETALNRTVTFVTSDSRMASDGALFAAFKGARVDGHDFMAGCLKNGAVACISEREPASDAEMPCIVVNSTLSAMGRLAKWHRSRFDLPIVGITGSVGKTTTKEMIAAVLAVRFNTHKTEKNFNNELGVPQTLLRLDDAHQASVVEMGINHFGEMRRLTDMVRPTIAVFSIIGYAHLEFLGDRNGVYRAKGEIFEGMSPDGLAVVNGDDDILKVCTPPVRKVTFGLDASNDFHAENIRSLGMEGIACTVCHHNRAFDVTIPAFGQHMVYAALAAAAVGNALGLSDSEIAEGIARYQTVGDRARVIHANGITVISDCYNANPNSTGASITSLAGLEGRKVCILGDMLELGENSPALHAEIGALAAEKNIDCVYTSGELSQNTFEAAKAAGIAAAHFETRESLIEALPRLIREGDTVLVKASHSMQFEKIVDALIK